jgi:glycosyltransferase involved in cell wall biosynthesis
VLFVYGSDVLIDPQRSALHKWITTRIIRLADLVLVDSEVQRSAVISLGAPPKKIVSFPWVDSKDFLHTMPDLTLRDGLDWGDNVVVVSTRMHEAVYAVDTLIRAIPIVAGRCPNVRFLLFGAGAQTTKLIDLARELKVEEFVHFAGLVERNVLLRYLSSCDMYVSTALSDGTSSSLLEAMSLGVPVVVTRSRGNLEWVTNHYSGLLFDKRDYCELAKAIVHLACDPEEAVRLTQNAKKTIARRVNSGAAFKDLVRMMSHAYSECRNNR